MVPDQVLNRLGTFLAFVAALFLVTAISAQEESDVAGPGEALLLQVDGAIGPATRDFIIRALEDAAEGGAELVIIQIDTPGGLDASTRDIVQAILNSPVPVATYVAPAGARAASAGTYILLASHIAAMGPATNVGAATPVNLIGGRSPDLGDPTDGETETSRKDTHSSPEADGDQNEADDQRGQESPTRPTPSGDAMSQKVLNDSVAYIRGLAARHGRNADWAERAVREADSITSEDALDLNVIDLIAGNVNELLADIDGRTIELAEGEVVLDTGNLRLVHREPDWRSELLAVITDPTIAYLLLLIGFYGLVLEGYHPGAIVPGVVGAICLLLALYALQMLPVNYAGLALIILGIILIIAETLAPSFGALGIGGIIALVIGSVILMDTDVPGFEVSRALIGSIALASSVLLLLVIGMAVRARNRPMVAGREHLVGERGTAAEDFDSNGLVYLGGELWSAVSTAPLSSGQDVEVTGIDGLTLNVKPID
jgi:membrane-bound serine protease (ClpP class)